MKGYWNRPEESENVLTAGRLAAHRRHGRDGRAWRYPHYRPQEGHDRRVRVQGLPNEIEDVLTKHPGVLEAAAIGVHDERSGEAVKVVVLRKDPALTESDLIAHCSSI